MEPHITEDKNEVISISPQQKESLFASVNRVTPLSKTLAAIIFIILPFIGGYVGYQLALTKSPATGIPNIENSDSGTPADSQNQIPGWTTYTNKQYGFSIQFPSTVIPETAEATVDYTLVNFVPDRVMVTVQTDYSFDEVLARETQSPFQKSERDCSTSEFRSICITLYDHPDGQTYVRVIEGNGKVYTIFAISRFIENAEYFIGSFVLLPVVDMVNSHSSDEASNGFDPMFDKNDTTIRYVFASDRSDAYSDVPFDYYSNYQVISGVTYLDDEAYASAQKPYLNVMAETDSMLVFSVSCFVATECMDSGLYKFDKETKTLETMDTSHYYNRMLVGVAVSPDQTKLLITKESDEQNGQTYYQATLGYIDLLTDTFVPLKSFDPYEPYRFGICELGCTSELAWVDDDTVSVAVYEFEQCMLSPSPYEQVISCGTKKFTTGGEAYISPVIVNTTIEVIAVP